MNKLVSVIIPVYNASTYIKRCIYSVLNQSYANIEVIAINDGSVDETLNILESISINDSRLKILSKDNEGVSKARNDGLKLAQGEYICFLDSDDYYHHNYIEIMRNSLEKYKFCDAATLIKKTIKKNNLGQSSYITARESIDYLCQMKMPTSVWAYMYKRELLMDIYFNPEVVFFEDFLFNYYVLNKANNIALIDKDLYFYESNPEGLNGAEFSEKKFSSINIIELLLNDNTIFRSKYIFNAYAFFIVSNLLFIAKSNSHLSKYNKALKKHSRKCIFNLNPFLISPTYYILTAMSAISPYFTIIILKTIYYKNINR